MITPERVCCPAWNDGRRLLGRRRTVRVIRQRESLRAFLVEAMAPAKGQSPTNFVENLKSTASGLELSPEALFTLKECEQAAMRSDWERPGWGVSCSITPVTLGDVPADGREGREPGMVPREGEPAVITQPQKLFSRGLASLLCTFWRITWQPCPGRIEKEAVRV